MNDLNRRYYQLFLFSMLTWSLGFSFILAVQAETASPSITDATPAIIEPTPTLVADASPSPKTTENAEAAPGTYYDKGSVDKFEGTPDGDTGNSAGEIIFMLVIFLFCLFFVVEAIVHWIRKNKKRVRQEDDWRKR